jgi:fido (protein-threonine AMPylation protein)
LNDHLDAVDFVFDIIKNNRPVTNSFVKELHALVTRNQEHDEGRDQFGNKTQIGLLKGKYKERENNPTRSDGTSIMYCPPEHVASEMDNLISFYEQAESEGLHPIIISAWFHHAFSTIHPFQDGNGRVARLMSSLILIKHDLFPFTVLRKDAKEKYIDALEKADQGEFQGLVDYFASVQKRHIEKVLNLKKFSSSSFEQVTDIFNGKLEEWQNKKEKERQKLLDKTREEVFQYGVDYVNQISTKLRNKTQGKAEFYIDKCPPKGKNQDYYQGQIIKYAKKHDYFFNRNYPKSWILLKIDIPEDKSYQLGISFHHYGYDDNTLAIGAFLENFNINNENDRIDAAMPLEIKPHTISISQGTQLRQKNIERFLEDTITIALAQIANEL